MPRKKADAEIPVGKKIRKFRLAKKIPLERIANETGCSVDRLKQIEAAKAIPPVGLLLQISKALEIDSGEFLKDQESTLKSRIKAYTKRTDNYAYETLTPGAENKHLKAFRITVESKQEHKGVGYQHDGEEFVYVLSGKMEVTVGEQVNKLKAGDSLHFNSGIRHNLRNVGKDTALLIVVIYQP